MMLHRRHFYFSIGLILILSLRGSQANAQAFFDDFNQPDQAASPQGWTVVSQGWEVSNGAMVGESSIEGANSLAEAWTWAGAPPVELPPAFGLLFDMEFLSFPREDDVGRHAGVMFCATRATHRWDSVGRIGGYELDWIDRDRTVRLLRIDPPGQVPPRGQRLGDVNCDGVVDEADVQAIGAAIPNGGDGLCCPAAADWNGDGIINVLDITGLRAALEARDRDWPFVEGCELAPREIGPIGPPIPVNPGEVLGGGAGQENRVQVVLATSEGRLENPPRRWQVLVDANTIRVLGDNQLILEAEDSRYRGGHMGCWIWRNGSRVAYDNVSAAGISLLTLDGQGNGRLRPGIPGYDSKAFCFRAHREAGAPGNNIVFSLRGQPGDENILLLAWGRLPTATDFDMVANLPGESSQRLVVPYARNEDAYIVVLAKKDREDGNGYNSVTVTAELPGLLLEGLSIDSATRPAQGESAKRVTTSVFGAGFTEDTVFRFMPPAGRLLPDVESRFVSSSHVLLTLELTGNTLPGNYRLDASNGAAGVARLEGAFLVESRTNPGILQVTLVAAGEVRPFRARPLQVRYRNIGGTSLAPRLLRIHPPVGVQLKLADDFAFSPPETPVDILTVNSTGYPGALPPGVSSAQNLIYVVNFRPEIPGVGEEPDPDMDSEIVFTVEELSPLPNDLLCLSSTLGPNCAGALTKPVLTPQMPNDAWGRMRTVLGENLGEFVDSLGGLSTRLALRGRNPASVAEALRLATHTAWTLEYPDDHYSAAIAGVLRDSIGNPLAGVRVAAVRGSERGCGETMESGFFLIEGLRGGAGPYQIAAEGFNLTAEATVPVGGEVSLGSVVTGSANNAPFVCELVEDSLVVGPPAIIPGRLSLAASIPVEVIIPIDPNRKSGTAGQSNVKKVDLDAAVPKVEPPPPVEANVWIPYRNNGLSFDGKTIIYEIVFENDELASSPAQKVDVFDCLPPEFDPATFRFLGVGVDDDHDCTSDTVITGTGFQNSEEICLPPSGGGSSGITNNVSAEFNIDMRDDDNVDLQVICQRDGNQLSWQFISLQHGSSQEVQDDGQGFLQPHHPDPDSTEGEAWVQFSVELRDDAIEPGALFGGSATVVFKDLEVPVAMAGQVIEIEDDGFEFSCDGGGGGGAGQGGQTDSYWLETAPVYHVIPRESYFPNGCFPDPELGEVDDDQDGLADCDDEDCNVICTLPRFMRGNANNDVAVDLSDSVTVFNYLFNGGVTPPCLDSADINDDGSVDISDGIFLLSYLFQGGPPPPTPGMTVCGVDLTPDGDIPDFVDLGCEQISLACE